MADLDEKKNQDHDTNNDPVSKVCDDPEKQVGNGVVVLIDR